VNKNKTPDENNKANIPGNYPNSMYPGGNRNFFFWIIVSMIIGLWLFNSYYESLNQPPQIDYTTFRQEVKRDNVKEITVKGDHISGTLKQSAQTVTANGDTASYSKFTTYSPSFGDKDIMTLLSDHNVRVKTQPISNDDWWPVILTILPFIIFLGIGYYFFKRIQGQGQNMFSIGQSQAKLYERKEENVTFDDVAGAEGAKLELREIVDYLTKPDRILNLGGTVPKGVLLVGPPGTGKTLLARAVAGEANVPFFSITGSDFMEMFVGVGAKRVRTMFQDAKKAAPSIIFIDELDSIGRRRGAGLGGGHDEREQTLNQMLSELDGFEPSENVIVMAATNRPDILDRALLRPGRFDRRITVDLPTKSDRVEILKIHSKNKPLAEDADLEKIARATPGFSGADLKNLLNEAALLAARNNQDKITLSDIEHATDKILMGLERTGLALTKEEQKMIAYHEAGHALVAVLMPHSDPIHKVTIVPRGQAMGVTQQLPERDKYIYPREYMLDRLAVMMGGRAAEDIIFNTATSGAENDLKQATKLARKMVLNWGMSKKFGHIAMNGESEEVFLGQELGHRRSYSEETARELDNEVKAILDEAYKRATNALEENREVFDQVANLLLEKEEIPGEDVLKLLKEKSQKEVE
jgi:cell division protease FtsH